VRKTGDLLPVSLHSAWKHPYFSFVREVHDVAGSSRRSPDMGQGAVRGTKSRGFDVRCGESIILASLSRRRNVYPWRPALRWQSLGVWGLLDPRCRHDLMTGRSADDAASRISGSSRLQSGASPPRLNMCRSSSHQSIHHARRRIFPPLSVDGRSRPPHD